MIPPLVYLVHPAVARLADGIPALVSWAVLAALIGDLAISGLILRQLGTGPACNGITASRTASFGQGAARKEQDFCKSAKM